ncbi:matrixin family metalloprotease [Rheinheimera sp.]|uniref:matrixin family metalloprotease n=1 Tax=Rheinheimera sp. TaxID=1869214 RepID=UPI0027B8D7F4|nr:matrixin family metalloprotease [Rheinheimera sp.]
MHRLLQLLFVGILAYLAYSFWQKDTGLPLLPVIGKGLCSTPLGWKLGYLDPAFNLTETEATAAISQAAQMWNQAFGRTLLQQDPQGFVIDFRFDARQQQLLKQRLLSRNLNRYDQAIEPGRENLPQQFAALQQQIDSFNLQTAQLQQQIAAFKPDAPNAASERAQLERRQRELKQEADWLEQQRQQLVRDQDYLNETIKQRNALLTEAGPAAISGPFEVGLMKIRGQERLMTIYAFGSQQDLVATLAHEFGHAFGVEHTSAEDSIMYHSLSTQQAMLTAVDIAALQSQCGF